MHRTYDYKELKQLSKNIYKTVNDRLAYIDALDVKEAILYCFINEIEKQTPHYSFNSCIAQFIIKNINNGWVKEQLREYFVY